MNLSLDLNLFSNKSMVVKHPKWSDKVPKSIPEVDFCVVFENLQYI